MSAAQRLTQRQHEQRQRRAAAEAEAGRRRTVEEQLAEQARNLDLAAGPKDEHIAEEHL